MFKNKERFSKVLAVVLVIISLLGLAPATFGVTNVEPAEKVANNENIYTVWDGSESDFPGTIIENASREVSAMSFATADMQGKNIIIKDQTKEIIVRDLVQHGTAESGTVKPYIFDTSTIEPGTEKQYISDTGIAEQNTSEQDTAEPNMSEPDISEESTLEQDTANQDITRSESNRKSEEQMRFANDVALLLKQDDSKDFFSTISITADDPTMRKDGKTVDVVEDEQVAPVIEGDVFMVPLDMLVDNAGSQTDYVQNDESVLITNEEEEIEISLTDGSMTDSHSKRRMRHNTSIRENQVFVPLEDVAEALGYTVDQTDEKAILSRPFQTKRLIVKALSEIDNYGAIAVVTGPDNLYVLQYQTEEQAKEALEKLCIDTNVVFAQTDNVISTAENDPLSWGVTRMNAHAYQEFLSDSIDPLPEIVVGVLDTGIDSEHPHFRGRIIPNDYDYTTGEKSSFDGYFHGTHVAGTIVDATLPNVMIQPYKVLDDMGNGSDLSIYMGIIAAADKGVDVINMSITGRGTSVLVYNAVMYALDRNIAVVVAAGNNDDDVTRYFPAQIEEVITVAAVDKHDQVADFSNWGDSKDIAAAGMDVLSAVPGGGYESYDGTSMASPHVAAAAAMLKTYNKTLTPQHIEAILRNSADDAGPRGWDEYYGDGILNLVSIEVFDVTAPPVFSRDQGWYQESFELVLTSATDNTRIYYTLDGSVPTESSKLYTNPILVTSSGKVRARAFSDGRLSSSIVSRLYHISRYPATMHYTDMEYFDFYWHYQDSNENTQALKITFSENTDFAAADYDALNLDMGLIMIDDDDMLIPSAVSGAKRHTARELAGNSFYLKGNSFTIEFRGKVTPNTFGFAISNIEPITMQMTKQPIFDLDGEVFYESQKTITLTSPSPDTDIYYTIDGSIPTQDSTRYVNGIIITQPTVIKAIAIGQGMAPSYVEKKTYYVSPYPESLHYSHSMSINMMFPTWEYPGNPDFLKVTFSKDCDFGSDGIVANSDLIVQTIGKNGCGLIKLSDGNNEIIYNDYFDSPYFMDKQLAGRTIIIPGNKLDLWHFAWVTKNTYGFKIDSIEPFYGERVEMPKFSVEPGYYNTPQRVVLTTESVDASIYYTTDGTIPTRDSNLYVAPVAVSRYQIIRAIAMKDGYLDSRISNGEYYISKYPESKHDIRFNGEIIIHNTYYYEYPDDSVEALDLHFNIKTDFNSMRILDGDKNEVFSALMGSGYAGKTIHVPGNKFYVVVDFLTMVFWDNKDFLTSFYGFKIDSISPVGGAITPSLPSGTYDTPIELKLDSPYPYIYYTTDGSAPNRTSTLYDGSVVIDENTMFKAVGYDGIRYSYVYDGAYYVTQPPESLHNIPGWYDATWEYEFDGGCLIELVFDERSQIDDLLIYSNRDNILFDNFPLKIQQNKDGQKSVKFFGRYVNIQYLGGYSNGDSFGFKINKLSDVINDITDAFTDPNFRAAVQEAIGNPGGTIYEHQVMQIQWLNVRGGGIKSLDGIEYMSSLYGIDCSNNQLTSIDLSSNTVLESLNCRSNLLTSLDVSKYDRLRELDCRLNYMPNKEAISGLDENRTTLKFDPQLGQGDDEPITIPDVNFKQALINQEVDKNSDGEISKAEALMTDSLWLSGCGITDLTGIEHFMLLTMLDCSYNQLMTLPELPNDLYWISCSNNQLKTLPKLPNVLSNLNISNNQFESLSELPNKLFWLDCSNNLLTAIDLSKQTELCFLYCRNNLLTSLDVLRNYNLWEIDCRLNYMPSKAVISGLNERKTKLLFDPQYLPSDNEAIKIPDANFKRALIEQGIDKNGDGEISKAEAKPVEYLNVSEREIKDLSGIEYFACLTEFYCFYNKIEVLPKMPTTLTWLDCAGNQLESLPKLPEDLVYLSCLNNKLYELPMLPDRLFYLHCGGNQLTELPVLPANLIVLSCDNNRLTSVDISGNEQMNWLVVTFNNIKSIDDVIGWRACPLLILDETFWFYPQNTIDTTKDISVDKRIVITADESLTPNHPVFHLIAKQEISGTLNVAAYDAEGRLIETSSQLFNLAADKEATVEVSIPYLVGMTYKFFIWDDNYLPLTAVTEVGKL